MSHYKTLATAHIVLLLIPRHLLLDSLLAAPSAPILQLSASHGLAQNHDKHAEHFLVLRSGVRIHSDILALEVHDKRLGPVNPLDSVDVPPPPSQLGQWGSTGLEPALTTGIDHLPLSHGLGEPLDMRHKVVRQVRGIVSHHASDGERSAQIVVMERGGNVACFSGVTGWRVVDYADVWCAGVYSYCLRWSRWEEDVKCAARYWLGGDAGGIKGEGVGGL